MWPALNARAHLLLLEQLTNSADERIAAIAAKGRKEVMYHLRRSADLVVRLGDGTDESRRRMQGALDDLWLRDSGLAVGHAVRLRVLARDVSLTLAPQAGTSIGNQLRGTVEALLPSADVYITDWADAREVSLSEGSFDLDDYIDYVIEMIRFLGPDTHLVAVCQPSVPVLAAVAVMEEIGDPLSPASMTLMGGPIDTRINPTAVNMLAMQKPLKWFEDNVIMQVPWPQPGVMRNVYPGFLQLSGFMSMNLDRHMVAHKEFFMHLVKNNGDSADKHREFYDEYLAVMDLTAEFYLQTVDTVFIRHALPKGEMMHRDRLVDPSKIRKTALLTVEGENDDISGVGQTKAAQTLCSSLNDSKRMHYVQPDVGHYGVFNGSRFRREIAPRIIKFMHEQGKENRAELKSKVHVIEGGRRRSGTSGK